jgi:ferric-dicitrate binding protein FerR (iron transport regulator)
MERNSIEAALAAYRDGTLDRDGLRELLDTLREEGREDAWSDAMRSVWDAAAPAAASGQGLRDERMLSRLQALLSEVERPRRGRRLLVRRSLAVAAVLFVVLTGGYWFRASIGGGEAVGPRPAAGMRHVPRLEAADRVTLTRADGTKVLLDEVGNGVVAVDASAAARKADGGIDYAAAGLAGGRPVYNTIATPRGGRFRITLSDGSRVWLNAASSLRFPVAFPPGDREVEVTGQAFFEVARQSGRPFRVKVGDAAVEVLGTHFDIMAYPDEAELRTTLVEGSVRFRNPGGQALLAPGQQAYAAGRGSPRVRDDVDTDRVLAWKEGVLAFRGDDIGHVCRTLSRAYDVSLTYDEAIRERFYASFPQETGLETVLKALEMTGRVRFERRGTDVWAAPVGSR